MYWICMQENHAVTNASPKNTISELLWFIKKNSTIFAKKEANY
jgi:hypothetical protein